MQGSQALDAGAFRLAVSVRQPRPSAWFMVGTPAVSNLIRENKIHQVPSIIQTGKKDGMQLLDEHIMEFLMSGQVDAVEAYTRANNKSAFLAYLKEAGSEPPLE